MSSILDRLAAAVLGSSPDRPEPDVREAGTQIPPEYPRSFAEFVGQPEAILLLRTELAGARAERRMPAHFLLYGPPGLGKTALAYVVAAEAGMSFYESSGAEFSSQAALIEAAQLGRGAVGARAQADPLADRRGRRDHPGGGSSPAPLVAAPSARASRTASARTAEQNT